MRAAILAAPLLAGCGPLLGPSAPVIPARLLSCPEGTKAAPLPPKPWTAKTLGQMQVDGELAWEETQRALDECSRRLAAVVAIARRGR